MSSILAIDPAHPNAVQLGRTQMSVLTPVPSRRRADEVQFWAVYLLTLPVFLVSSLVGRLLRGRPGSTGERLSVIKEAKASAQTCGSFSLMG